MTTPDIYDPVVEICKRLGLDPAQVKRLDVGPTEVVAEVYELNENGFKFIRESGEAAIEVLRFDVTTIKAT